MSYYSYYKIHFFIDFISIFADMYDIKKNMYVAAMCTKICVESFLPDNFFLGILI